MTDRSHATTQAPGYLLSEESHQQLEQIRDQLFLMAMLTFAITLEEENTAPLEIRRSTLGQCFENFGFSIDDVLEKTKRPKHMLL